MLSQRSRSVLRVSLRRVLLTTMLVLLRMRLKKLVQPVWSVRTFSAVERLS